MMLWKIRTTTNRVVYINPDQIAAVEIRHEVDEIAEVWMSGGATTTHYSFVVEDHPQIMAQIETLADRQRYLDWLDDHWS